MRRLPNGAYLQNINNRSVKLSQGDLMLCRKCEAAHFPLATAHPTSLKAKKLSPLMKTDSAPRSKQLITVEEKRDKSDTIVTPRHQGGTWTNIA